MMRDSDAVAFVPLPHCRCVGCAYCSRAVSLSDGCTRTNTLQFACVHSVIAHRVHRDARPAAVTVRRTCARGRQLGSSTVPTVAWAHCCGLAQEFECTATLGFSEVPALEILHSDGPSCMSRRTDQCDPLSKQPEFRTRSRSSTTMCMYTAAACRECKHVVSTP